MSVVRVVKLMLPAGAAKPGPALGQALGPLGINMSDVCKQVNDQTTAIYKPNVPLRVDLTAMTDRTFTLDIKAPPTSHLIKKVCGIEKGAHTPGAVPIATITPEEVYEIARIKQSDKNLAYADLEGICRSVIGSAKSMGVAIKEEEEEEPEAEEAEAS